MQEFPVLCHSDLVKASISLGIRDFNNPCGELLKSLESLGVGQNLWFPTFNMDFGRSQLFDLEESPSQVGVLGEYVRNSSGSWRTSVPFYSVTGFHRKPSTQQLGPQIFDVWGKNSVFGDVYTERGKILILGSGIASFTQIHFVELLSGGPIYRYSKSFSGLVSAGGFSTRVELEMHVRPPGNLVDYDWEKIFSDLNAQGLVEFLKNSSEIFLLDCKNVTDFLVSKIADDPLYLLSNYSRQLVQEKLDALGRPFTIGDFE
jgi:aminoglycoside N3'-acetyltransferase